MTLALALALPAFAAPGDIPESPPSDAPAPVDAPTPPDAPLDAGTPEVPDAPTPPRAPRGAKVVMNQRVEVTQMASDLFLMAQEARTSADVADNAFIMAQTYEQVGTIHGDLFVMAETVVLDGPIEGDVYALADRVEITDNAEILGTVQVGAGSLELSGPIAGDLSAEVGRLVIASPVAGDVKINVEELDVRKGAVIGGDLTYSSSTENPELEAMVGGEVEYTFTPVELDSEEPEEEEEEAGSVIGAMVWWAGMRGWGFFTKLLVGSVLLLIGGERIAAIGRRAVSHPGQSLGMGFVVGAALPVASLLALATVVPFPLGLLGFAVWFISLYVAQIFAAQAIGDMLLKRVQPDAVGNPYLSLAIGLVPLILLCALPWLGTLAWIAATLLGLGAMWSTLRSNA